MSSSYRWRVIAGIVGSLIKVAYHLVALNWVQGVDLWPAAGLSAV